MSINFFDEKRRFSIPLASTFFVHRTNFTLVAPSAPHLRLSIEETMMNSIAWSEWVKGR